MLVQVGLGKVFKRLGIFNVIRYCLKFIAVKQTITWPYSIRNANRLFFKEFEALAQSQSLMWCCCSTAVMFTFTRFHLRSSLFLLLTQFCFSCMTSIYQVCISKMKPRTKAYFSVRCPNKFCSYIPKLTNLTFLSSSTQLSYLT